VILRSGWALHQQVSRPRRRSPFESYITFALEIKTVEQLIVLLIVLAILSGLGAMEWKAFLFWFRPDAYQREKDREHKEALARQETKREALGLCGSLFKLFK
jgi:hypothetical protein